jgi:hypothetical protein
MNGTRPHDDQLAAVLLAQYVFDALPSENHRFLGSGADRNFLF